jgi:hypothetical protein
MLYSGHCQHKCKDTCTLAARLIFKCTSTLWELKVTCIYVKFFWTTNKIMLGYL